MKTRHHKHYLFLMVVVLFSCKKEDPKPQSGGQNSTPIFSFIGDINGTPITIQAGVNGYSIVPSYTINKNNVMEFDSEFKNSNCISNCPNTLKISITDSRKFSGTSVVIDSSIIKGYYPFATPSGAQSQFIQTFVGGLINGKGKTYNWDFGDGSAIAQTSSPTINHKYSHIGIYNVTLTIQDSLGSCSSSIVNDVRIGQLENTPIAQYITTNNGGNSFTFVSSTSGGASPYSYYWDFGDGSFSTSSAPTHIYSSIGVYSTSLLITDAMGNSDIQHSNLSVQTTTCASFYYTTAISAIKDTLDLSSVIVEWQDINGTLWTSEDDRQNSENSSFKIVSNDDYIDDQRGEPTEKITVEFSCILYNGSNSMAVKNAKTTFAVSYK